MHLHKQEPVKTETCSAVVGLYSMRTIRLYSSSCCLCVPDFSRRCWQAMLTERVNRLWKKNLQSHFCSWIKLGALCHTENRLSGNWGFSSPEVFLVLRLSHLNWRRMRFSASIEFNSNPAGLHLFSGKKNGHGVGMRHSSIESNARLKYCSWKIISFTH